ncbi:hypothetical protein BT96DRAFT_759762, partial [Gymnopus androsaceus JB14]
EKLSADNYAAWAPEMEAYLKVKGTWEYVDPSPEAKSLSQIPRYKDQTAPTSEELKEMKTWRRERSQAAGTLFLCITESQKAHVKDAKIKDDPRAIWITLRDVHQQKKPGTRFNAFDSLFAICLKEDEKLDTLISRVSESIAAIKVLHPKTYSLDDLDKELEAMALIRSLPPDYNSFVSSLLLLDTLDLTKLRAAFQTEQIQR